MPKTAYFPSPLRKDYNSKPFKSLTPIIPQPQPIQPNLTHITTEKYQNGTLTKLITTQPKHASSSNSQQKQHGIFINKDNICVIYALKNGLAHGFNYFIFPNGIRMCVEYKNGILDGWIVGVGCGGETGWVLGEFYSNGIREGIGYYWGQEDGIVVISQYKKGKVLQIDTFSGQLQTHTTNKNLLTIIQSLQTDLFILPSNFPSLLKTQYKYYGQLKEQTPHGNGIMLLQNQIYLGNFNFGLLDGINYMKLQNHTYFGFVNNGICTGYGCVTQNQQKIYQFAGKNISKTQFTQYLTITKGANNGQTWIKFKGIQGYFERFLSNQKTNPKTHKQKQQSNQNQPKQQETIIKTRQRKSSIFQPNTKQKIPKFNIPINHDAPTSFSGRSLQNHKKQYVEIQGQEFQPQIYMLPNDQDFVASEFNFMMPQNLETKNKIVQNKQNFQKKNTNAKINLKYLIQGDSQISSAKQEEFFRKF